MSNIKVYTSDIDTIVRCSWCQSATDYVAYHDTEWGYPVDDDRKLFEKICLEGFQAGLSWYTILKKRENFRRAFCDFDFTLVAQFTDCDITRLVEDEGIIRHKGKITATINNAKRAMELKCEFGSLAKYFWQFEPTIDENLPPALVSTCPESIALSKDLKKRGWKFVGPTTVYAFMQAMGMVNDHAIECMMHKKSKDLRASFKRP